MGSIFRSETISLCQLFIQPETVYNIVACLGEVGLTQFRDLNSEQSPFDRWCTAEVRRCEEVERKITFMRKELKKADIDIPETDEENLQKVLTPKEFSAWETVLERYETEILELCEYYSKLQENDRDTKEMKCMLDTVQKFFSENERVVLQNETENAPNEEKPLNFLAGIIERSKLAGFERMLWRVSKGNLYLHQNDIEESFRNIKNTEDVFKNVFITFFQGDQLKDKIKKISEGYHAALYPCSEKFEEREEMRKDILTRINDLEIILNKTKDQRDQVLMIVAREIQNWEIMVKKIKSIYHIMNLFNMDMSHKCTVGECWVPEIDVPIVQKIIAENSVASKSSVASFLNVIATNDTPPTYYRSNKFTNGFQALINAYGVSNYQEVNPALCTIITFPFLFAVMFGDLGHGLIIVLIGAWMVFNEKTLMKWKGEAWNMFFGGRYIILLMGLFSCYTGFIYNDIFSKSIKVFDSSWQVSRNSSEILANHLIQFNPRSDDLKDDAAYFMMDPVWAMAKNKIIFLNSYKMKMSIIIGVVHMILGLFMSAVNNKFFKNTINIFLEFLPQMIFLLALFGYLAFMLIFKWIVFNPKSEDVALSPKCAPSVLIYFINMFLFGDNKVPDKDCREYMYDFQFGVQIFLFVLGIICIPWMLLAKPLYLRHQRLKNPSQNPHEEPISELFVHQAIHTIEYVLSTISNTASYLRLWALSLAHSQLSEVLWGQLFHMGLIMGGLLEMMLKPVIGETYAVIVNFVVGSLLIFLLFGAFAFLTFFLLVVLEGLSAFLHTLRLHWVEYMSKFYAGEGYAFQPYSFKAILKEEY